MQFDDDKKWDNSGTPPDEAAKLPGPDTKAEAAASRLYGSEPGGPADAATPPPTPPAPPAPQSGWTPPPPPQWAAPSGQPNQWGPPPPAPPTWHSSGSWGAPPPPPAWQPGQGWQQPPTPPWQPQPGWGPSQTPGPDSYGTMPPAGDAGRRRPSRLPQMLVVIAACLIAFSGGMLVDHSVFPNTTSTNGGPGSTATANGTLQDSSLYNEAVQIVKQNFVGRSSVTDQQLLYGSIKGLVDSLGDTGHSTFLTPQEYQSLQASLSASVAGIGVILSGSSGAFTVDRVVAGSPAEAAGVKAGDVITAVDGTSTTGLTIDQLSAKVRGTAGTQVTITVLHVGSTTPVDITMTRANITVPLTGWGMVPGTHTADIVLVEFSTGASDQVKTDIAAAQKAGATSLILDLRGNPGGYAAEAQEVASEFLSSGIVYIEQDAAGNNTDINVDPAQTHSSLPLVVLVDHDSASSSEIVAGALQDSSRAKIVGEPTYGTGTVLQQFQLSDGSVIFLGTRYWLTPDGHRIFGVGIKPDQVVAMPTNAVPTDPTTLGSMTTAQFQSTTDAQLLTAVKDLNP
ncbi:MAG: S41 family peptidase [Candidatus Limnocylindrales bacterium]